MLSRPLTLNDGKDRGRGLVAVTLHTALPLAAEHDDVTPTGVFSPAAVPSWRSSSSPSLSSASSSAASQYPPYFLSSPSSTSPPPIATGSLPLPVSSSPPPLPASVLPSSLVCPPPPLPLAPASPRHSVFSSSSLPTSLHPSPHSFPSVCAPPPQQVPPVSLPAPSPSSHGSPSFSSAPPPSVLFFPHSHPPSSPPASPPCFTSTSSVLPSPLSLSSPPPSLPPVPAPPLPLSSSTPLVSIIPTPSTSICTSSPPPPPALVTSPPPTTHDSCPLSTTTSLPSMCFPLSSSSSPPAPPLLSSQHPPPFSPPCTPPLFPPAHCCPCSSLLPRILSAHRLEVRRLLRGAVASLGRRLDSLERRSRRKTKKKGSRQRKEEDGGAACSPGYGVFPRSSASSCGSAHLLLGTTCSVSSTDNVVETIHPSTSLSQSELRCSMVEEEEEGEQWGRKRRKKHHRGRENRLCPEFTEEEDAGRFVGRMEVSFRRGGAGEEEVPLTLNNFNHSNHKRREGGGACQLQKAISVVRQNRNQEPLLHSLWSTPSQNALQSSQNCSQSESLNLMSSQWHFTDSAPPLTSSNHRAFRLLLWASPFDPAPMFQLSAVAMETISNSLKGGACGNPSRPLKDWTAPPSLRSDHCYVRLTSLSTTFPARRQQKLRTNHSSRSLHLTRRRPLPLPPCSSNGLPALLPSSQAAAGSEFLSTKGERGKRVSQIRIRRAPPREASLTPMGLPKAKRLKKKEFSLEEIYTNKNYKSPSTNRSLETIFEEPREKDGTLLLIGQQKRRRVLLFPDFTQPRKRKRLPGAGLPVAMVPRKRAAARRQCHGSRLSDDESDLDVMLVERLSALEDFLSRNGLDL